MHDLNLILTNVNNFVWGLPLIVLITFVGIVYTFGLKFIQIIHLPKAIKYMFENEQDGIGEVSTFAALCTALSATIGTGNIVGVATAISTGGPGALFWLEVGAFFGMATKYAEGFLAIKFRNRNKDGTVSGGPFCYIEKGMGNKYKWLAVLFALFGVFAGTFGMGTITQVNSITSAVNNYFNPLSVNCIYFLNNEISIYTMLSGIIVTLLVSIVIFGGIKSISKVSEFVVPVMALVYMLAVCTIIVCNISKIPSALGLIIKSALNPKAFTGGAVGSIFICMQKGISRGIFSNEAGLGSAPIAAASAKTREPVRQGLVCMLGAFIDTTIICTLTGFAVIVTDAWIQPFLEGTNISSYAFKSGLPFDFRVSEFILMICLVFFAFTSILGWNYYSEKCFEYLFGCNKTLLKMYRVLYLAVIFFCPYLSVSVVWIIADIFNGLMAIPNLIALIFLSKVVLKETKIILEKDALMNRCFRL